MFVSDWIQEVSFKRVSASCSDMTSPERAGHWYIEWLLMAALEQIPQLAS